MHLSGIETNFLLLPAFTLLLGKVVLIVTVLVISLLIALYSVSWDRKMIAFRRGGQSSNSKKTFEVLRPLKGGGNSLLITGAGVLLFALVAFAVIPWGDYIYLFGWYWPLQIAEINVSLLFVFTMISIAVTGLMLTGWVGKNKAGLGQVMKATTLVATYELVMCVSLLGLVMVNATLRLDYMVYLQKDGIWNVFYQPLGFLIFFVCALAVIDLPDLRSPETGDSDEHSLTARNDSPANGFYLLAKYLILFLVSAFIVTLYFGGYDIPFVNDSAMRNRSDINWLALWEGIALLVKIVGFILLFLWIGRKFFWENQGKTLKVGWKILLPLAFLNMLGTGLVILFK